MATYKVSPRLVTMYSSEPLLAPAVLQSTPTVPIVGCPLSEVISNPEDFLVQTSLKLALQRGVRGLVSRFLRLLCCRAPHCAHRRVSIK
jgi:hypothetical protein